MKKVLQWTPLALKDLVQIRDFIRRDKPLAAKKEAERIRKSAERLAIFPESGQKLDSIPNIRKIVSGNYHIFYHVRSSHIEILRIYHGKRVGLGIV